jgi:hypothetical protein
MESGDGERALETPENSGEIRFCFVRSYITTR